MKLDERDRPLRVGEGRISGYLSVALGTLSLLAVLCFMFPDFLTTPSLRANYDLNLMRKLLAAGMVFSAGFGLLTFLLNRKKRLGALGGPLKYLVATPLFHHWHHGSDKEAIWRQFLYPFQREDPAPPPV